MLLTGALILSLSIAVNPTTFQLCLRLRFNAANYFSVQICIGRSFCCFLNNLTKSFVAGLWMHLYSPFVSQKNIINGLFKLVYGEHYNIRCTNMSQQQGGIGRVKGDHWWSSNVIGGK